MIRYYTTFGDVRRGCGHKHRSIRTATACLVADQKDCRSIGGYSDRLIVAKDAEGNTLDMSPDDQEQCHAWEASQS